MSYSLCHLTGAVPSPAQKRALHREHPARVEGQSLSSRGGVGVGEGGSSAEGHRDCPQNKLIWSY